jgi:hypothetical protein
LVALDGLDLGENCLRGGWFSLAVHTPPLVQVQHVPFFRRRLEALRGRLAFAAHAAEALAHLELVASACLALATSDGFKDFLNLVLLVGPRPSTSTPCCFLL